MTTYDEYMVQKVHTYSTFFEYESVIIQYNFLLSECEAPELDGSVQGGQRPSVLQVLPKTQNPSAERGGGAPTGPHRVPQHEVTHKFFLSFYSVCCLLLKECSMDEI